MNPNSAGVMEWRRLNLYPKAAVEYPDFEKISLEQHDRQKVIIMQDQVTQIALQQAYHSRFAPRGKLAKLESAIPQLNQWVVSKYRRALAELPA
jgi:hypothetical protein